MRCTIETSDQDISPSKQKAFFAVSARQLQSALNMATDAQTVRQATIGLNTLGRCRGGAGSKRTAKLTIWCWGNWLSLNF